MIQDVPQVVPEEEFLAFWEASKSSGRLMVDPSAESSEEMESHLAGVRTGARRDAKGWGGCASISISRSHHFLTLS